MKIKTENIFQVIDLDIKPSQVYNAIIDEKLHSEFTGEIALIEPFEGGKFNTFANRSSGYFLKLVPNKKVVLAWRHENFPENIFSIVDIELQKTPLGTRINFNHIAVPEDFDGFLTEGWKKNYWIPLRKYLQKKEKTLKLQSR